ncbi:MAG: TonB-dependent receptor [Gammaproteobacteria bacterium]
MRHRASCRHPLNLLVLVVWAAGAGSVTAQPQVEEIFVTAQKREQSLQDVPIAVSAVTGDALQAQNLGEVEALSMQLPNIHISESGIGDKLFIRGIGSGINAGFEQSVGTFVDGVYYGRSLQTRSQFLDIERVEVLRGPQSTFFGNNAIAGALNITTRRPDREFSGYVNTFYEFEHDERHVEAAIGGALTDTLSARIAGLSSGLDGWVTNLNTGQPAGEERNRALRASFLFTPNDTFDALLKVEGGSFDVRGRNVQTLDCPPATGAAGTCAVTATPVHAAFGPAFAAPLFPNFDDRFDTNTQYNGPVPRSFTAAVDSLGAAEARLPIPQPAAVLSARDVGDLQNTNTTLTLNWQLAAHMLTAVSGFSRYEFDFRQPTDFVPLPLAGAEQLEEFDQFSQEVRLVSDTSDTLDYMLGAYWQTNELDVREDIYLYLPPPYFQPAATFFTDACRAPARQNDPTCRLPATIAGVDSLHAQEEDSWAGFGSLTWHIGDALRVTFGARYTHVEKSLDRRQAIEDRAPGVTVPCIPQVAAALACTTGAPLLITAANPPRGRAFGWKQGALALERNVSEFTPSLNLQWDMNDDAMLYASYTEGFKAGGFDQRNLFLSAVTGQFEPESVDAAEFGLKSRLLDDALMLNVALFRSDYDDLQVSTFDGVVNFLVNNAGSAHTQGIETDMRWALGDSLVFSAAVAVLDAQWEDYRDAQCTALELALAPNASCFVSPGTGLLVQDLSGADMLMAPDWSGNVGVEHYWTLGGGLELQTQLLVYFEDDKFLATDNDPATLQERFAKVNLRVALVGNGGWELAFVGRNLTNELTSPHIEDLPLRSTNSFFALTDRPRTYAVQGQYRF